MLWIDSANSSVHVLIYSFTLDGVGSALVSALDRGVDVKVVFEKDQISTYSEYRVLEAAGVPVRNDSNRALVHDKIAIVDGYIVLTGSYNWSSSAEERNNENLLVYATHSLHSDLRPSSRRSGEKASARGNLSRSNLSWMKRTVT